RAATRNRGCGPFLSLCRGHAWTCKGRVRGYRSLKSVVTCVSIERKNGSRSLPIHDGQPGHLMQRLVMSDAARDNEQTHSWACGPTQDAVELSKALQVLPMPRTVLVVDDERDTNDILANLVRPQGFEPIQVFSGLQALSAVADRNPNLILLD